LEHFFSTVLAGWLLTAGPPFFLERCAQATRTRFQTCVVLFCGFKFLCKDFPFDPFHRSSRQSVFCRLLSFFLQYPLPFFKFFRWFGSRSPPDGNMYSTIRATFFLFENSFFFFPEFAFISVDTLSFSFAS